jgi:hypothetical protein
MSQTEKNTHPSSSPGEYWATGAGVTRRLSVQWYQGGRPSGSKEVVLHVTRGSTALDHIVLVVCKSNDGPVVGVHITQVTVQYLNEIKAI